MTSLNQLPPKRNIHTFISILTALLVAFLAAAAFVLSFEALRSLAALAIPARLTFLFPLVVDGFIIVASLAVLRGSLGGVKHYSGLRKKRIFQATIRHPSVPFAIRCSLFKNSDLTISGFKIIICSKVIYSQAR